MSEDFPDHCIRGIDDSKHVNTTDNTIKLTGYLPDTRTANDRRDGFIETSVNWEDNTDVLEFTLKHRNNEKNRLSFPHGVVKLNRDEIDRINSNPATQDSLSYERRKVEGNPYHGNILFRSGMPQVKQNLIASVLALYSSKILRLEP